MANVTVKRFDVIPTSLTIATVTAILGLIQGLLVMILGAAITPFIGVAPIKLIGGIGVMTVIIGVITGFIIGFIGTAIFCIIYNLVADKTGGIRFEME